MLSQKAIDEFKEIYFRKFGIELSQEIAFEMATEFMNLFITVTKPLKGSPNELKKSAQE